MKSCGLLNKLWVKTNIINDYVNIHSNIKYYYVYLNKFCKK